MLLSSGCLARRLAVHSSGSLARRLLLLLPLRSSGSRRLLLLLPLRASSNLAGGGQGGW